jgi:RHS repeat-associated protein
LGKTAIFAYDAVGHLTASTDRLGRTNTFSYDAAGRRTGETQSGGTTTDALTFTYDNANNLLTAANSQGTYTLAYDADNRVTAVQGLFGVLLTFSYDAVGNRTLVTDNFGGVTTSLYDAVNNLTSRQFSGTGQSPLRIDQAYDAANQVSGQTRYADLAGTTVVATTSFTYDAAGRLTDEQHKNNSGGNIAHYTYSYDAANHVLSDTTDGAVTSYGYDAAGELTSAGAASYSYDGTGNRTGGSYITTAGNQLQADGTWTYTYDAEGNVAEKLGVSNGLAWTYAYDNHNRLTAAMEYNGDPAHGGTLALEVDYKYDAFGNRVEQDVTQGGNTTTTHFAYDGWESGTTPTGGTDNVAWNVWADLTGANALQTRYVRGNAVDELFARLAANSSQVLWELTDRQGSVRVVLDGTGTVQDQIAYDAYGNIASETVPASRGRYAWTGREYDGTTGLQYNRARNYDPATGRWISQDPLGFGAGDSNFYRYVKNDPTDLRDPSGLVGGPGVYHLGEFWPYSHENVPQFGGEESPLAAAPSLKIDVLEKANMVEARTGQMKVKWQPQNVKKGGFVIQHLTVYREYCKKKDGKVIKEQVASYWEAWEVDAKGVVYIGYIKDKNGKHNADTFRWPIPDADSAGFLQEIGYARYVENYPVDWKAGGVEAAGALPSTDTMPKGWTDEGALKHGFKITWDDFNKVAPKIAESWP